MKIGIFGGTFNPVHNGHMNLAECYKEKLQLDKIIFIPTATPPHKVAEDLADDGVRLDMLKLALKDKKDFEISDAELLRKGKSYTFDTVSQYKEEHPDDEVYLIIGSDMFLTFHEWYRYRDILSMVTLCSASRENEITVDEMEQYAEETLKADKSRCIISDFPVKIVSSSEVRKRIYTGEDFSDLVPSEVYKYILENGVYFKSKNEQYRQLVSSRLSSYRANHSFCVAESAVELCERFGGDKEKAYVAGLLHDVMKEEDNNTQLQYMQKVGIIVSTLEKMSPKLYHAISGAAYCRFVLGIDDDEIISAIRYHTTGKQNMSQLEKIIFLADFISADRSYDDIEVIRDKAKKSLDEAILYGVQYTIKELADKEAPIHEDTLALYNQLTLDRKRQG